MSVLSSEHPMLQTKKSRSFVTIFESEHAFWSEKSKQVMEASKEARQTVSRNTKGKIKKNDKKLKARRPEREEENEGEDKILLKR